MGAELLSKVKIERVTLTGSNVEPICSILNGNTKNQKQKKY